MKPMLSLVPRRHTHAFEVAPLIDLYLTQLSQLDRSAPAERTQHALVLTRTIRDVRLACAPFPPLARAFIPLLIGHAELVYDMARELHGSQSGPQDHSALLAAQRAHATTLLCKALEPPRAGPAYGLGHEAG